MWLPQKENAFIIIIDFITLIALTILVLHSRQLWVFIAAASQLNCVAVHLMNIFWKLDQFGFTSLLWLWGGWGPAICLAFGNMAFQKHRKRSQVTNSQISPKSH